MADKQPHTTLHQQTMEDSDSSFQSETIELKRKALSYGQLPAHRCQQCEPVLSAFNPPLGQDSHGQELLYETVETETRIGKLARSGCKWWSFISSLTRVLLANESKSTAPKNGRDVLNPYDTSDPELPPALMEHHLCGSGITPNTELNSNQVRLQLFRDIPKHLREGTTRHTVKVDLADVGGTSRPLTVFGHPSIYARGSERLASPINVDPGSASSFVLARHWINRCTQSHGCGIQDAPSLMPRILLCLTGPDMEADVRITETQPQFRAPYVALSYCWGRQGQRTVLKRENKQRLLEGISLDQLDPSIQDAIKVTRELGFQYLWIDALCIIQDDDAEKAHDIVRMHDTYRNAAFTIIASRSASVSDGFLSSRVATGARFPSTIFSLVSGNDLMADPNSIVATFSEDSSPEPWESRAWTLQEILSSGRLLRFASFQTSWSCQHGGSSYKDCDGWLLHPLQPRYDEEAYSIATKVINDKPTGLNRDDLLHTWHGIVHYYSNMTLTYHKDRLPAISSIARAFARVLGDVYIGGHWQSSLHADLLWRSKFNWWDLSDLSWSWASGNRNIMWPLYGHAYQPGYLPMVADADFQFMGFKSRSVSDADPYGAVDSAKLTLRGLLAPFPHSNLLSLSPSSTPNAGTATSSQGMMGQQRLQQEEKAQADLKLGSPHHDLGCVVWEDIYKLHGDRKRDHATYGGAIGLAGDSSVFLFVTARVVKREYGPQLVAGLLLQYNGETAVFSRAGVFEICPWVSDEASSRWNKGLEVAGITKGGSRRGRDYPEGGLDNSKMTDEECTERIRELWGGVGNVRTVSII